MDKDMTRLLDVEKLEGFWESLEMQVGAVKEVGEPALTNQDSLFITLTPIQFEKQKLGFKLVFTKEGKIGGMFLEALTAQYISAAYLDESKFFEVKRTLPDPKYPVEGLLTIPNKGNRFPVVIIAAGSGPSDKDLTMGPNRVYKDLAWGLACEGVAVFRFDKRTKIYGKEMAAAGSVTAKDEYLYDIQLAIETVKKYPSIDSNRIFILGHSEGGYLIPYFEKNTKGVAGYISLSGNYSQLAPLVIYQLNYLKAEATKDPKAAYDALINQAIYARDKLRYNSPSDSLPFGISAKYLLHLNENGPAQLISGLNQKPILVLQGERDYQVPSSELLLWRQGLKDNSQAEFELFPLLNHLGLEGKGKSLPAEYQIRGNLPQYLIRRISGFVLK